MLIPWEVDVPEDRYPIVNWLIIAGIVAAFLLQSAVIIEHQLNSPPTDDKHIQPELPASVDQFILHGWNIKGLFGHMWLHGGLIHLAGNLIFLWIFGNAVCAKIGNLKYLFFYLFFGLFAAAAHLIFEGGPAIGASGAIFGVVGMFLVLFPLNDITCYFILWLILIPRVVEFTVSSFWIILFWFAYNLAAAFLFPPDIIKVAFFAHLGGFLSGFVLGIVLLLTRVVVMEPRYERSLLDILANWRKPAEEEPIHPYGNFQRDIELAKSLESQTSAPVQVPSISVENMPAEAPTIPMVIALPEQFIHFCCTCGKKVKIPAKYAGKTGRCPACKKQIRIPDKP